MFAGQSQTSDEIEITPSSDTNRLLISSGNSRQVTTRLHAVEPPQERESNFIPISPHAQTSYTQIYPPNVTIQNVFVVPPHPTGNYGGIPRTNAIIHNVPPPYLPILSPVAGSQFIFQQHRPYGPQAMLPSNSFPAPLQYIEPASSLNSPIGLPSNHNALSSVYNSVASTPAISEMPAPEPVNDCKTSPDNSTSVATNQAGSEIAGPSKVDSSSDSNPSKLPEAESQGDTIFKGPYLDKRILNNSEVDSIDFSILDEILADDAWKNDASNRILQGLLTTDDLTRTDIGKDPLQESTVVLASGSPPVNEPSSSGAGINHSQPPSVPAPLINFSAPLEPVETTMFQTPLKNLRPVPTTPSSADANRSTVARDVLRALQPPSAKRKLTDDGRLSPSLALSPLKKTKTGDINRQPVPGVVPNRSFFSGVIPYGSAISSTSAAPLDSITAQYTRNVYGTDYFPASKSDSKTKDSNIPSEERSQDLGVSIESSFMSDNVTRSHSDNHQIPLSATSEGHRISNGLPDPHMSMKSPYSGLLANNKALGTHDKRTNSTIEPLSQIMEGHQSMQMSTILSSTNGTDANARKSSTADRETLPLSADLSDTSPNILSARSERRSITNSKSSLSPRVVKNRTPLFLPSDSPPPVDDINSFGELATLTNPPTDEPSLLVSPVSAKRVVPSNVRPYVSIRRIPNLSIKTPKARSAQPEGREKRGVSPETPEVVESRSRLTARRCSWRDCEAVLDSAEKLIKHTKVVHGSGPDGKGLYRCYWLGCTRLGAPFTSTELLRRHLKDHVLVLITCPYKGCDFETDQGSKLVGHIAAKHDNQRGALRQLALPDRQPSPHSAVQPLEVCPTYFSVPIPVRATSISKERHYKLEPFIRAYIVGNIKPKKINMRTKILKEDSTTLPAGDNDYDFQQEESARGPFGSLRLTSPVVDEIDVLEGNLLHGVVMMEIRRDGTSVPDRLASDIEVGTSFRDVDPTEGLGTGLGPNLLQTTREENNVEALL